MTTKEQRYAQATERAACQVTDSFEDWTEFLKMAGRLYKYPFDQQLLVYAQRQFRSVRRRSARPVRPAPRVRGQRSAAGRPAPRPRRPRRTDFPKANLQTSPFGDS